MALLRRLFFSEEEQTTFSVALDDVQEAILNCDLRTPEHPVVSIQFQKQSIGICLVSVQI